MPIFLQKQRIGKMRKSWHKLLFQKPQHATTKSGYQLASWYPIFGCRCVSFLGIITNCPSNPTKTTRGSTPEVVTGRLRRVRPTRQNNTGFDTRGCQQQVAKEHATTSDAHKIENMPQHGACASLACCEPSCDTLYRTTRGQLEDN